MSLPVRLCQYDLPNGKLCRQIALKEESVCRHHMRNFRHNMYEVMHAEAMERFEARLNQMDLPELLVTLESKLNRIQKTMPVWDEARVTLRITLQHIIRRNNEDAMIQRFVEHPTPADFQNLCQSIMG
jgi:hypothetical protein